METPEELNRKREAFFNMCDEGSQVLNAAIAHLLRFNFRCITLEQPAGSDEVQALTELVRNTRECVVLIRQTYRELFDAGGSLPPFDLMLARLDQTSDFLEVVIERSAL